MNEQPGDPMYFDQDGQPMDMMEWARQYEDTASRILGRTQVGAYRISTVWLGLNHAFLGGPPLIFETMVFGPDSGHDIDMVRYHTKEAALAGHDEMVLLVTATTQSLEEMMQPRQMAQSHRDPAPLRVDGREYRRRRAHR